MSRRGSGVFDNLQRREVVRDVAKHVAENLIECAIWEKSWSLNPTSENPPSTPSQQYAELEADPENLVLPAAGDEETTLNFRTNAG